MIKEIASNTIPINMSKEGEGYRVLVYTKRHPNSFVGPSFIRNLLSYLSETENATWGDNFRGMSLEEAQKLAAKESNHEGYIDGRGKLRTSRGVVAKVDPYTLFD